MQSGISLGNRSVAKKGAKGTLAIAFGLQAVVLALTLFVAVEREVPRDPPAFEMAAVEPVESRSVIQRDRLRELNRRSTPPRSFRPLAVDAGVASELPPVPQLPEDAFAIDQLESAAFAGAGELVAESGLLDLAASLGGAASATEFFGVKASGRRIVIVVNTSASVVRKASRRGVTIEKLQGEAIALLDGLESGTLFGVVQFSQGNQAFADQLAPALQKNKRQAAAWIREELRGNPPVDPDRMLGHEGAFEAALSMDPDLIFLVTDGSLNRRVPKSGGGYAYPKISFAQLLSFIDSQLLRSGGRPQVHVVGFELGAAEREGLSRLAKRFRGELREF